MDKELKIKFFPHQMSVIRWYQNTMKEINAYNDSLPKGHDPSDEMPKHLEIALMGGVGWGKTYLSHALALPIHGLRAKTKMIMCMENATLVNATIRADLEDKWKSVIKSIKEGLVTLVNGTEIFLIQGYDQVKGVSHLDNYNISFGGISQGENLPGATHEKLGSRCRNKAIDGETLIVVEGNPKGRDWIDKHFCHGNIPTKREATVQGMTYSWDEYVGKKLVMVNDKEKEFHTLAIYVPTQNFPWLPVGYLERQMEGKSQRWIDRYILGKRDAVTGLVYDCWNETIHLIAPFKILPKIDQRFKRVLAIDWGRRNPACCLWSIYDTKEDTFYVYREYYKAGHTPSDFGQIIRDLSKDEEIDMVLIDPATKQDTGLGDIKSIIERPVDDPTHWTITDADNSVKRGVDTVYEYLSSKKLFVFKGLDNLVDEIIHYEYGDDVDKPSKVDPIEIPKKKRDHALDCLKYLCYNVHKFKNDGFIVRRPM